MLKNITKFDKCYTNIQVELHKNVAYKVRDLDSTLSLYLTY